MMIVRQGRCHTTRHDRRRNVATAAANSIAGLLYRRTHSTVVRHGGTWMVHPLRGGGNLHQRILCWSFFLAIENGQYESAGEREGKSTVLRAALPTCQEAAKFHIVVFRFNWPRYHQRIGQGVERMRMSPQFHKCEGFASVPSISDHSIFTKNIRQREKDSACVARMSCNGLRFMYFDRNYMYYFVSNDKMYRAANFDRMTRATHCD
jgi:hypothetical protein